MVLTEMTARLLDKLHVAGWGPWCLRVLLCLAVLYVAVMLAWVGDDAQITFRQVWNFIHGDGMTFNHGERVQAFTHPAWFFLLSGAVAVTGELHATTLALSIALSMAAVVLLLAAERRALMASVGGKMPLLTPVLLLLFSSVFLDYTTSGLESPLSYFLIAALLWLIAADDLSPRHSRASGNPEQTASGFAAAPHSRRGTLCLDSRLRGNDGAARRRRWMFLVLALLVLCRPDYSLLFLPFALWLAVSRTNHSPLEGESERQGRSPLPSRWGVIRLFLRDVWPGALLLLAWFGFALLYFGSPLSNTFYAKIGSGAPAAESLEQGINYYRMTLQRDPATLFIIAAGLAGAALSRRPALLALAAGQVLYLGFILKTGGGFMLGRFFAAPVFLSVGLLAVALNHPPPPRT